MRIAEWTAACKAPYVFFSRTLPISVSLHTEIPSRFRRTLRPLPAKRHRNNRRLPVHPVRDKKRFNLFFKNRFPIPDFKYFSRAVASC